MDTEDKKELRSRLTYEIDALMDSAQNLPQHAMMIPLTQYDYISILSLLKAILESSCI